MHKRPKAIPQVVAERYPKAIREEMESSMGMPSPP